MPREALHECDTHPRVRMAVSHPMMDINLLQWPAMMVTLIAAWAVGSRSARRRRWGFCLFVLSKGLWVVWGAVENAWALVLLQAGLFALNIRGAQMNERVADEGSS